MDDIITLFCLVHGDNPVDRAFSVKIPKTNTVDELKKLIKAEKSPRFDDVVADELTLWRVNICQDELEEFDFESDMSTLGEKLSPLSKIYKVFPNGVEDEHLHIIVVPPSVRDSKKRKAGDDDDEALRESFYKRVMHMLSPSKLANPKEFGLFQSPPCILNQRPSTAVGLPVALCSPILAKFQTDAAGDIELDDDDMEFLYGLSVDMCSLTFQSEGGRGNCFKRHIGKYFGNKDIHPYPFNYNRETDSSIMYIGNGAEVPLATFEFKPEIGLGNGCAFIQSCVYYVEFLRRLQNTPVLKRSRLPSFLVYLAGLYVTLFI